MPAGRPTKYTPELLEKAETYIESTGKELPSIEDFAIYLDIRRSTVYEWQKEHEEFSDILDRILAEQAKRLMNNGLNGKWNATIAKLVLGKHGYSERTETDLTTKGEKLAPTVINIIKPIDSELQTESETVSSLGTTDGQSNE